MLNTLVKTAFMLSLSASITFGYQAIRFNISDGDAKERNKTFNEIIEVDLEDAGFTPKDTHPSIEFWYNKFYGTKLLDNGRINPQFNTDHVANLDNLGFITISNEEWMLPLLIKEPSLGGFAPLNILIYKKTSETKTYVGTLTSEAMLDITKVKDLEVRQIFAKHINALSEAIDTGMGGEIDYIEIDKLRDKTMVEFEIPFERGNDVLEAKFGFMDKFEKAFEAGEFIIAGKRDFEEYWSEYGLENNRFDAYWVYSLCHFKFSYTVFNVWQHPELGVSAPCSMYMYLDKGSNSLKIGMPSVKNWITFGRITDPEQIEYIREMDEQIKKIMISLGAKEI